MYCVTVNNRNILSTQVLDMCQLQSAYITNTINTYIMHHNAYH